MMHSSPTKDKKPSLDLDSKNDLEKQHTVEVGEVSNLAHTETHRGLKSRHSQMIALGGTIGTSLFVGSGQALRMGGPLFLFISYTLFTVLVFGVVTATTEMSAYLPVPGCTMAYFANRFYSRSLGFALGWMYWYIFAVTVPAEITAASLVIQYWDTPVHIGVWITLMFVIIVGLNCFPVSIYGETEFWFASTKVIGIMGMLIMALVITCGGGPTHKVIGFSYWKDPGAVNSYIETGDFGRLIAFVSTLCFSVYAFAFAPELLVVTAGEMKDPRRNLPKAGQRFFYRLLIFYVLGSFFIGLIIASNDERLLGGGKGAGSSPWALAAKNAGMKGLDSVINAVILLSAWSAGNSFLYLATRSLYSLAVSGNAPKVFQRCTASGVPYVALATSSVFSLLAYLNVSEKGSTVFNWFINLTNSTGFLSWVCICVIYIRFRKATEAQGVTDLPYRSIVQPYASYFCGSIFTLLLLLNGFVNFLDGQWETSNFVTSYVCIPILGFFYFGHVFLVDREAPWVIPSDEVDLHSGLQELAEAETQYKPTKWYQTIFG